MAIEIKMPALSPTMTTGTLAKWLVGQGDRVNSGDVIAEIETDKATMEVESVDDGGEALSTLQAKLRAEYSGLTGFCIMLFSLISAPCVATLAITRRETNSWAWAFGQWFGLTILAYVITLVVYQVGSLFL